MNDQQKRIEAKLAAGRERFNGPQPPARRPDAKIIAETKAAAEVAAADKAVWLRMSDDQRAAYLEYSKNRADARGPAAWSAQNTEAPAPAWQQAIDAERADEIDVAESRRWWNDRVAKLDQWRKQAPPEDAHEYSDYIAWERAELATIRRLQHDETALLSAYRSAMAQGGDDDNA